MPAILIRILSWLMTSIAGQVLYSLGLGLVTYSAFDVILGFIKERMIVYFTGTSQNILIFINLLELDYYFSVLLSAIIIKSTMMSAQVALAKR